jgi:hypothetical protein
METILTFILFREECTIKASADAGGCGRSPTAVTSCASVGENAAGGAP